MKYLSKQPMFFAYSSVYAKQYAADERCTHPNQKLVGEHWRCERCGAEVNAVQG